MIWWDTFVLLGGGPSLAVEDVEYVREKARAIVINDSYKLAPWAFALYAADKKWIDWHDGVPSFRGPKVTIESHDTTTRPEWVVMKNTGFLGLEKNPSGLRTGFNSGFQSMNLAHHFGAKRIILLGFDMKGGPNGSHWFGEHPDKVPSPYQQMIEAFDSIVEPMKEAGIEVVNCTPNSALRCFPCASLRDAIQESSVCVQ